LSKIVNIGVDYSGGGGRGAILMMFTAYEYHALIMTIVIIPGYLLPGYVLKKQYRTA